MSIGTTAVGILIVFAISFILFDLPKICSSMLKGKNKKK